MQRPVTFTPIGVIHSPHTDPSRTPIQPVFAKGVRGTVEVLPEHAEGLADVVGFSHLHLLYWFDRSGPATLRVVPFLDDVARGVFATRAPNRPNPIGLSVVRLVERRGALLVVEDVDILDGTPLLDIKPYVTRFDRREPLSEGWQEAVDDDVAARRGARGGSACPARPPD